MLVQFLHRQNHLTNVTFRFLLAETVILQMVEHLSSGRILHQKTQMLLCSECSIQRNDESTLIQHTRKDFLLPQNLLQSSAIRNVLLPNHLQPKQTTRNNMPNQINLRSPTLSNTSLEIEIP